MYSKARKPGKTWVEDSKKKEEQASNTVMEASDLFLKRQYIEMLKEEN